MNSNCIPSLMILYASIALLSPAVLAGGTNDYPWMNKTIVLHSTDNYQFFEPVARYEESLTYTNGQQIRSSSHSITTEVCTVSIQTDQSHSGTTTSAHLRILNTDWTPERNSKVLEGIASQVTNAMGLSMDGVRTSETRYVANPKAPHLYQLDLLRRGQALISLSLQAQPNDPNVYMFYRTFTSPFGQ